MTLLVCCTFQVEFSQAQVIWSEDFESYAIETGYVSSNGTALVFGDYPTPKWAIDVTSSNFSNSSAYFKVGEVSSNKMLEARRLGGEAVWTSETIAISDYIDVSIELAVSEVGPHESGDYAKFYYQLDGGPEVAFSNNGENYDDFSSVTASHYGLVGDSIKIIVKILNNANDEKIRIDNINVKGVLGTGSLILSEVANPFDNSNAQFVEIKNVSSETIDFSQIKYYLSCQDNGDSNAWNDIELTGVLPSGGLKTIASNSDDFGLVYGYVPDYIDTSLYSDGRDAVVIYSGGDHTIGAITDIYGKVGEDGVGHEWEYGNSRALRNSNVTCGVADWYDNASQWVITVASTSNMTPDAQENELRFIGSTWRPSNMVPSISSTSKSVVVQSGTASISENIDCASLEVYDGATLRVDAGKGVTVNGAVVNKGLVKLKANATSNASLILTDSFSGSLQYDHYLTAENSNVWHLIAPSVAGSSISDFVLSEANDIPTSAQNNYAVAAYNSVLGDWIYMHNGLGDSPNVDVVAAGDFEQGKGYAMMRNASGEVSFSGTILTTDIAYTLVANKWNLIGNPYPSFLNANIAADAINNVLTASTNGLNDAYEALYIWNPESNAYDIINQVSSVSYISPGQGFFVYADSDGGDVNFTEAMQSHRSGAWFERDITESSSFVVHADFESTSSSTKIKYTEGASIGLDAGFDAGRFTGGNNDFYISSKLVDGSLENIDLGLQCLSFVEDVSSSIIPLELRAAEEVEVTFTLSALELPENVEVYMKDVLLNRFIRMDTNEASYSALVNEHTYNSSRFFIHIQNLDATSTTSPKTDLSIYVSNNLLYIFGAISEGTILKLYDAVGKCIYAKQLERTNNARVNLSELSRGLYVVELIDDTVTIVEKLVL